MRLLAFFAASRPEYDVQRMAAARFTRFLDLPHGQASVPVQIDLEDLDHGMLRARLLSRRHFRGMARVIGSPFPLDGAMHAACVHGQRLVDVIPFPVAFARRTISRPTAAGEDYGVRLALRECTGEELAYDIQILDRRGRVCESVEGLGMRDVSGGKIRPPSWIRRLRTAVG